VPAFCHQQPTTAPAAAVWAVWSDPSRWPDWDAAVRTVELGGPFARGTRGHVQTVRGPRTAFRLARVEAPRGWTELTRLPLARLRIEHDLVPSGAGVSVRHRLVFTGLLGGPWSRLLGRRMAAALPASVRSVVRLAEAAGGGEPKDSDG